MVDRNGPAHREEISQRASARGRFIWVGDEKRYIRGVTYGTFRPDGLGCPYPDPLVVARDFLAIGEMGANAVRLYTPPPGWLLDLAVKHGLVVMVGLAWEEHVAFLNERGSAASIVDRVERAAASCAGHPAILCYAVGNEIPSSIVRWHGSRRTERFIERLCSVVKGVDPEALVTYVNYPSTEYLQLPFLDLVSFNVYLESGPLEEYVARLQNIAADRPLLIAELGLDSRRNGEAAQAHMLERQLRSTFASGCAGAFVFSWTDEWHRGGVDVDDWNFGLVDRERRPKPALAAVERAFSDTPFPKEDTYPSVSVVICTHNGEATLATCLDALSHLDYPDYAVIVVDDGSTDRTAQIAQGFDVSLITTENRGLSSARTTGLHAARGEIVAFTDDDAWPDRDWLKYLAAGFASSDHVGIGGPNLPPEDGSPVEMAVARGPGGPIHVLLSDREAEHIPGCNMAFRREALQSVGGFDPQFRVAGDDVDMCWRLQEYGWTLGFSPAAVVTHRRRGSLRSYLRQQFEYGKAEALLEKKWPAKYNRSGHLEWAGSLYGGSSPTSKRRSRIHYGTWGGNLFQSIYDRTPSTLGQLPLMPEWYLVLVVLALLAIAGSIDGPLFPLMYGSPVTVEALLFAVAIVALVFQAARAAWLAPTCRTRAGFRLHSLTALLFLLQPLARLAGRMRYGLSPWRRRGDFLPAVPRPRNWSVWSERWRSHNDRLLELEHNVRPRCMSIVCGGDYDRWDIQARLGPLGAARLRLGLEEHGHGQQLVRYRIWPRWSRMVPVAAVSLGAWLAASAAYDLYLPLAIAAAALFLVVLRAVQEAGAAVALMLDTVQQEAIREQPSEDEELLEALRPSELLRNRGLSKHLDRESVTIENQ